MTALPPSTSTDVTTTTADTVGTTTTETPAGSAVTVTPVEAVPVTDHITVRMVIGSLALYLLAVLAAEVTMFLASGSHLPDSVLATGAVALGALGSMLTSTRSVQTTTRKGT